MATYNIIKIIQYSQRRLLLRKHRFYNKSKRDFEMYVFIYDINTVIILMNTLGYFKSRKNKYFNIST